MANTTDQLFRDGSDSGVAPQSPTNERNLDDHHSLSSDSFAPLRIRFDTRLLEELLGQSSRQDAAIHTIINTTLPAAANLWSQHLYVRRRPLDNHHGIITLSMTACRRSFAQERHFRDADLVIVASGDRLKHRCRPRQLAYASVCERDPLDDRPVVGKLEFCLEAFAAGKQQQQDLSPVWNCVDLAQHYQQ